ncbi:fumarylacetoacetase [Terracidiphilus sp.]|jgi:fumarylacetoacetase|uniref:fumarylacetoacetase n=1 Tax=Terracidiphilus sp. TaxID=1964191 RepID=UPI003C2569AD
MALKSWLASANDPGSDFPIQNLPYGAFRYRGQTHIGIAIGDRILDLFACTANGLLAQLPEEIEYACRMETLNALMELGPDAWQQLHARATYLLDAEHASDETRQKTEAALVPMNEAEMQMPARIGDYTDFYASIDHATRVGKLFRPDNPLLPNYKYVPIGYHGRASSVVLSGTGIRRPCGQTKAGDGAPVFGPAKSLDYELEVGMFVGPGNRLGDSVAIDDAERHIFGLCLVNDWSARDMQAWEYQPLGPFLAKSFATTISPWIVPLEALAPYRIPVRKRAEGAPAPLAYLRSASEERDGIDLTVETHLETRAMREAGMEPERISRGNLRDLYWSLAQLLTHHTSNGCNLRVGDLLATGTISGPDEGSEGCLLEMRHRVNALRLATGEERTFLEDGDRVILRAYAKRPGLPRIGFGECAGLVEAAR